MFRNCQLLWVAGLLGAVACGARPGDADGQSGGAGVEAFDGDRGDAEPIEGESKLVTMPNGDTLTVPVGYELNAEQGLDSLVGQLNDDDGEAILRYDMCGLAGVQVQEGTGMRGRAVNVDFHYTRFPEDAGALVVTIKERGPANLVFGESVAEDAALKLARTYTAVGEMPDAAGVCNFVAD